MNLKLIYRHDIGEFKIADPKKLINDKKISDIPTEFAELHKDRFNEYLELIKQEQQIIQKRKTLLKNLREDFIKDIKKTNPEYFL